jgi:hypothetical protein
MTHCIVCPPVMFVFWSLYFLSSCYVCLLVIVLSVLLLFLSFDHCIFCPPVMFVFWSLYCLFSWYFCLLVIVLSVLLMTKRQKYQEDRQYNDQKTKISGGQTIQWPKDKNNRRTDNTMTKRSLYFLSSCYVCLLVIVFSVLLIFLSFGHCIVCPPDILVFWSLYFLSSCYVCLLVIVLSVLLLFLSFGHCIVCPPDIMTKRQEYQEDRKYNDQKTNITGGQKIQWPKDKNIRRTENTMTKRQKYQGLSSWYFCLLVIVLSVLLIFLSFGHCIVCPPVNTMTKRSGGQKIHWPKEKHNRRTDNTMTKRQK